MGEPLSIVASVAGLISLGIQVTQTLVDFYTSYKHQDSDLVGTIEKLNSLLTILKSLKNTLSNRNFQMDETSLIKSIETSIRNCDGLIHELQGECQKFSKATSSNGIREIVRVAGRRAIYPFRQSTLQKLDKDINELRGNLSIALNVLQLNDNKMIQDEIASGKLLLDLVRTSQISANIHDWLKAPDATVNHNAACAKKHSGTGAWFSQSSRFKTWLKEDNSFLWLHGFAGSGKSVLASTAIQYAFGHRRSDPFIGIAFFYFTFNDDSKQDESAMLRALLVQLLGQARDGHSDLTLLHDLFKLGIPTSSKLADCLWGLIKKFHHVYIILDALDEIPPDGAREEVLNRIQMMRQWSFEGLHLLVTSRDLYDIRISMKTSFDQEVKMRNAGIDKDIENFISSRLHEDHRLQKWLPYRNKIEETLAKRSQGVFRWVECQFQTLKLCPRSENHLDNLLNSLPRSLDETYERILCSIDDTLIKDARRILTLLCFAARPLTVLELIEGVAVELSPWARLDPKGRLRDADDVLQICPGLVDFDLSANNNNMTGICGRSEQPTQIVRIAHFSVQEYLESERIQRQKAAIFSLSGARAHAEITQICLIYWLEPGLAVTELGECLLEKYPLAYFAAEFWYHHYKSAESPKTQLDNLILKLFQRQKGLFHTWIKFLDSDGPGDFDDDSHLSGFDKTPVYYAALFGLGRVLQELLSTQQQENVVTFHRADINTIGGFYGHPLEAASSKGHEEIVDLLVREGANIHACGGIYGNALQAASYIGHEKIVQLLIEKGADVNAQGGHYGKALQAASEGGHEKIVQLLILKGADSNSQGGYYGNALQAASGSGHEKIVKRLIEQGADIHAAGGYYGHALQAASRRGHENIVQLLIDKGADIHAEGGLYGNALQAASEGGHEKIVQLLIEEGGADVNAQGGYYGNALQAASERGHEKIMQLLIEKGADIHAVGGHYGNTLQAASRRGHENVVRLLIEKGANIHTAGSLYGNALHAASDGGHEKIVELLIEHGADIHAENAFYGDALPAASARGHEKIVRLLIARGANIHAEGGYFYGNALQAASLGGHEKIVELLIEKGADVNAQDGGGGGGGQYGNALQAASWRGHDKIVKLLIEKGADVNAYCCGGGGSGNALQAASENGHEKIVRLLIDNGAGGGEGEYSNALQAASENGHEKIVRLLIDNGAGGGEGEYSNALQAALDKGHEKIVQLLIENGANVLA